MVTVHIAFFPAGDENTASSRIRVFSTARILQKRGIPFSIGASPEANVHYVQKGVTPQILSTIRSAKQKGHAVIYEIDDFGPALEYWVSAVSFRKMVRLADVLITASPEQQKLLATEYGMNHSIVLPSCIDYYPDGPMPLSQPQGDRLRILWFGSSGNFHLFQPYIQTLRQIQDVQLVFCMEDGAQNLVSQYEKSEFIPWSLSGFIPTLRSCHLTCLAHGGNERNLAKTNNKMITSITWGVPAIVTRTPQYLETAIKAGIERAVFSNESELLNVVENLRSPEARRQYLESAQPVLWQNQSPDAITDAILEIAGGIPHTGPIRRWIRVIGSFF